MALYYIKYQFVLLDEPDRKGFEFHPNINLGLFRRGDALSFADGTFGSKDQTYYVKSAIFDITIPAQMVRISKIPPTSLI